MLKVLNDPSATFQYHVIVCRRVAESLVIRFSGLIVLSTFKTALTAIPPKSVSEPTEDQVLID
jgi:hypothetical protein